MVGGTIIGIIRRTGETTLNVQGHGCEKNDTLCIKVKELADRPILVGDYVWWQGRLALWTPAHSTDQRQGIGVDIKLERIGYSFQPSGADERAGIDGEDEPWQG